MAVRITQTMSKLYMRRTHASIRIPDIAGTADRGVQSDTASLRPTGHRSPVRRFARLGMLVLLLAAFPALFSVPAQAQEDCDAIWCATLTVGVNPDDSYVKGFGNTFGSLSPNTFTHNGSVCL